MKKSKYCLILIIGFHILISITDGQEINLDNIIITWSNNGNKTDFKLRSFDTGVENIQDSWIAVGLNDKKLMEGADIVVCRYSPNSTWVKHYVARRYKLQLIDKINESVGLSNSSVTFDDEDLTCSFTRDNLNDNYGKNYFQLRNSAYLLVAYGSGEPGYHGKNKAVTDDIVSFSVITTISDITTQQAEISTLIEEIETTVKPTTSITTTTTSMTTTHASKFFFIFQIIHD